MPVTAWALFSAFGIAVPSVALGQEMPAELRSLLDLSDTDIEAFQRGEAVVRTPRTEREDVNLFGAVRVALRFSELADALPDILRVLRAGPEGTYGRLEPGSPPAPGWLDLPMQDIDAFPRCTVGKCDMKLTGDLIRQLATLDWSDRGATANRFMERTLLGLLDEYQARGNAALMTYHDKKDPQSAWEGLEALMRDAAYLAERDPAFFAYLRDYPSESARVTDVFFWPMDEFGLKPTLTLNHVAVAGAPDSTPEAAVVIKQLYAAHYFQSSVDVFYLGSIDADDPSSDSYVMYVSRGRFDAPLNSIERRMAERGLDREARETLLKLQAMLQGR